MPLHLRAGLSWCLCEDRAVFLDIVRDRYFLLPEDADQAFRAWAAGEVVPHPTLDRMVSLGILSEGNEAGRGPAQCDAPVRDLADNASKAAGWWDIALAGAAQLRAAIAIRLTPLAILLARLAAGSPRHVEVGRDRDHTLRIACAFRSLAAFLRATDQCLPRALAAKRMCEARSPGAMLVFGVRLYPFAAHSWVQAGDAVVVGDIEQVRLFTPILVVP